jgi:predicted ABC-type transport system involved in lysophospholipase L1 biosynthesis ATPase subunit
MIQAGMSASYPHVLHAADIALVFASMLSARNFSTLENPRVPVVLKCDDDGFLVEMQKTPF